MRGRPFEKGRSGNPAGRPPGSRNQFSEQFFSDLASSWEQHGTAALDACRKKNPSAYLRLVASVLPKDIGLHFGARKPVEELTDEELTEMIRAIQCDLKGETP